MINLAKYPIHNQGNNVLSPEDSSSTNAINRQDDDDDDAYQSLLQSCISQMNQQGFVCLSNFLNNDAITSLTASILELERKGIGFYSTESHNVFLEEGDAPTNDASLSLSSSEKKKGASHASKRSKHPRNISLQSSKLIINANDLGPHTPQLTNLFHSQPFLQFISSILQTTTTTTTTTPLHPSIDPYGKYYANIFHEGDGLNWHFDRSEYSISLILQPAEEGGMFQFAPDSKQFVEGWEEMPMSVDDVSNALSKNNNDCLLLGAAVKEPKLAAGDLYLFRGQNSLHRVSEISKGTRINVILTYNSEPNLRLNEYTLEKFFGVKGSIG